MTTAVPRVGIVILQYGRDDETAACLAALGAIDYPDYTVLVVDNHSPDGAAARLRARFPTLALHESPENLGFAGGCNLGIRLVLADPGVRYVLLLNNDTRVQPDFLGHMVAAAEADPRVVAVGALNFDGARHTSGGGHLDWWRGRYVDVLDRRPEEEVTRQPVLEVDAVSGSSMLLRASVLRGGLLLDPSFFLVFEETDWCVRARAAGGRIVLATRARLAHHAATTMGKPLRFYFRFRNRLRFMARHARPRHWAVFLPYYLGEAAGRVAGYGVLGRWRDARAVVLGVWDGIRGRSGPGRLERLLD